MLGVKQSTNEKEMSCDTEIRENALVSTLSEEQRELFDRYEESLSKLNFLSRQEAFIKGIKFATIFF